NSWKFKRSVDRDLPETEINYVARTNGFSFICDSNERINSIFLDADIFDQALFEIPFLSKRSEVLRLLGKPTKSGAAHRDVILGEYGAWDRFDHADHSIHVEYRPDADRIRRVTLMCANVVP
ncbi:hypothetical protein NKG95_34000, partial [Mesorhizobium sp. M1423]|uniref:hypothetical protein n=1 Tax=Mesorhizobium sp. M1423 TaxID=2957101 RepID=UPI003337D4DB